MGVAAALLLLHFMLVWLSRDVGIIPGGDDATYILLSKALRAFRYHDEWALGAPVHSQYPPVFPAMLAFVTMLFGENYQVFLALVALCSVAALAMLFDAIRIVLSPSVALVVLALCAVNPDLVQFGGKVMSEAPYMMFSVLAVWALARQSQASDPSKLLTRWTVLAILGATGAALTRTIGVTMIGAVGMVWLLQRQYRRTLLLAACGAVTFGSWVLWTILAPVKVLGRSYVADAAYRDASSGNVVTTLIGRVVGHGRGYFTESLPWMLPMPTLRGTIVDNLIALAVAFAFGAIGAWLLWKNARAVVAYVVLYGAIILAWPWEVTRYFVPLLPFIIWLLLAGAFYVSTKRRWMRPVPFVFAGAILITAISRDFPRLRTAMRCDRDAVMTSTTCYSDAQRSFFSALTYARQSTPDTAVFLTVSEGAFGYLAQRRVVLQLGLPARDSTQLLGYLGERGVDYVFLTPLRDSRLQHVALLQQICGNLSVVREFAPATFILRFTPAGAAPPGDNACAALQRYERESSALRSALST